MAVTTLGLRMVALVNSGNFGEKKKKKVGRPSATNSQYYDLIKLLSINGIFGRQMAPKNSPKI